MSFLLYSMTCPFQGCLKAEVSMSCSIHTSGSGTRWMPQQATTLTMSDPICQDKCGNYVMPPYDHISCQSQLHTSPSVLPRRSQGDMPFVQRSLRPLSCVPRADLTRVSRSTTCSFPSPSVAYIRKREWRKEADNLRT